MSESESATTNFLGLKLTSINENLFHLLQETRRSLAGQREFNVELVRHLSALISEADPLVRHGRNLTIERPELSAPLDHYLRLAGELHSELEKVNIMLLARRSSLDSARSQLHAASQFADALSATR